MLISIQFTKGIQKVPSPPKEERALFVYQHGNERLFVCSLYSNNFNSLAERCVFTSIWHLSTKFALTYKK